MTSLNDVDAGSVGVGRIDASSVHFATAQKSHSHRSPQCLFKRLNISPPPTRTMQEALNHADHIPKWCGKCLRNNPGHEEVDCPTRELC